MSKLLTLFVILTMISLGVCAQERGMLWQETIGGHGEDEITAMDTDANGNYYVTGTIQSENSVSGYDLFVSKMSSDGNLIWTKKFVGERNDRGIDLIVSSDNKLLVLAASDSKNGYFSGNQGYDDFYLFKLDLNGQLEWVRSYGGAFIDLPTSLVERQNGHFLLYGDSRSETGDLTANFGQFDLWLIDVDADGIMVWQKNLGGDNDDRASTLIELPSEEILLLGHSTSYDRDILQNYGDFDISLLKLSRSGNLIWSENFGGFAADYSSDLLLTTDGNILIAGNTFSNDIDIVENAGFSDAWVFEVSMDGSLNWSQTIGSSGSDFSGALYKNSLGQIIIAGTTNSLSIGNSVSKGNTDIWMAYIDNGTISDVTLFGDAGFDRIETVYLTDNDQLVFAGATNSVDGIVHGIEGKSDGWIAKFAPSKLSADGNTINIHPNPSSGIFYLNNLEKDDILHISDSRGQQVFQNLQFNGSIHILDLQNFPTGMYYLTIESSTGTYVHKVVKQN